MPAPTNTSAMFFSQHSRMLRKMGLKADQQGIFNRYLREQEGWDQHLRNTRDYIWRAAQQAEPGMAVVLGSGWLLDVPLRELASRFERVVLVDILHPAQVQNMVAKMPNVRCVETDITGGYLKGIFELVERFERSKKIEPLDRVQFQPGKFGLADFQQASFVASVNLLNQLDILATGYLKRQQLYPAAELARLKARIQQQHLQALPKGKTCLVTDHHERAFAPSGEPAHEHTLLLAPLPPHRDREDWQWKFDASMTYHYRLKTFFDVLAIRF